MITTHKKNKVRPRGFYGDSIGHGNFSNMTPVGASSNNLLESASFPDLLDGLQYEQSPMKQTFSKNIIGGSSPKSSTDFHAFDFPDLLGGNDNACDKRTVATNVFPDLDELRRNISFSEKSDEDLQNDEDDCIRQDLEATRTEQAERFKREQEARVKKAEEAQRRIQESEAKLNAIEDYSNQVDQIEKKLNGADQISSYDAIHSNEGIIEPIREQLPVDEIVTSSCSHSHVTNHDSNKAQHVPAVQVDHDEKNDETQAIFRKEVDEKIQETCIDPEMRLVRFDFEPKASSQLGLHNSIPSRHEGNIGGDNLEPFIFEPRSIDGSQITNSIIADDDNFYSSKITHSNKRSNYESFRKIGSAHWNNPTRNPHTDFLSRKYDSKRIVDILDSFSINQNNPTTLKNDCQDDAWSVKNPIAGISSLISAPRLCDATSKIPYSISFSVDEDDDVHTNHGSRASSSSHARQKIEGNDKSQASRDSRKPKVIVREDVHVRIKKKLAKVRSRKSNTYMSSKPVSSEESLDATASLSLSRSTDMQSTIKSGSTDPLPIPIAKFDEEKPWRKPTIVFHQLHTPRSICTPISNDLSEDQLIFHLKSRIQNLLAENVPTNIHVDHHNIILDRVEHRERATDNLKDQDFSANDTLLNSLRAKLRELECDFGSSKSEKTFATGNSIDEIKAKLRRLESSHSFAIHDKRKINHDQHFHHNKSALIQ